MDQLVSYTPRWPLLVHLCGAILQMFGSAFYHNYYCMSSHHAKSTEKYDMAGIVLMIMGSSTSPIYYSMQCEESWWWGRYYLAQMYTFSGIAFLVTVLRDSCGSVSWDFKRKLTALSFSGAGWSFAPFVFHAGYFMPTDQIYKFAVWPWLGGGVLYGLGAILYALKIPERYFKRTFDIVGSSHNLMHFLINLAALLHVWASF